MDGQTCIKGTDTIYDDRAVVSVICELNKKVGIHVPMFHQRNAPVEQVGSLDHSSVSAIETLRFLASQNKCVEEQ